MGGGYGFRCEGGGYGFRCEWVEVVGSGVRVGYGVRVEVMGSGVRVEGGGWRVWVPV